MNLLILNGVRHQGLRVSAIRSLWIWRLRMILGLGFKVMTMQLYWNKMTQMKFHLIYIGYHYRRNICIERVINILLAIVSTGSLGGLFLTSFQKTWAIILVLTQVLTAAKPYLPYSTRITELDKEITSLGIIYSEVERKWRDVFSGKYDDNEVNEIIYDYVKKWDAIVAENLKGDSLPRKKKFIEQANEENHLYFESMFGGINE